MPPANPSDLLEQFRDPVISMFQSAVAATDARSRLGADPLSVLGRPPTVDHASAIMQATTRAARNLVMRGMGASPAAGAANTVDNCAHAYLTLATALARGDDAAIAAAKQALPAFGQCDLGWTETITEFLQHYRLVKHGNIPYQRWKKSTDFVLGDAGTPSVLPANATVAVIGDWGNGAPRAQALLKAVAQHKPDILIHLGDIYYSCDAREANTFFENITAVFPLEHTRVFTLCGNHDMYGGGVPYYALLNRLGQPASFFCLRNANWQLLAMDTGYHDFDPLMVNTSVTWLRDGTGDDGRQSEDPYSELEWHLEKLTDAGGRRTVLLSHHPLFTRNSPIDTNQSVNLRLQKQFQGRLADIALWLWGHEHNQAIYAPFANLTRGRCLGASAIPVGSDKKIYDASDQFAPGVLVPGLIADGARLGIDAANGLWDLGYGILTLGGATGTMNYYSFNQTDGHRHVFSEAL
jgi:hypothetical protein